jgi:hypothetical protein
MGGGQHEMGSFSRSHHRLEPTGHRRQTQNEYEQPPADEEGPIKEIHPGGRAQAAEDRIGTGDDDQQQDSQLEVQPEDSIDQESAGIEDQRKIDDEILDQADGSKDGTGDPAEPSC